MDVNEIKSILPHRFPFLFVDRITMIEMNRSEPIGSRIEGLKAVSGNEPFFQGHFPDLPIMPGVLLIETMAQVGGLLILKCLGEEKQHRFYLTGVDQTRFRKPVVPGDLLRITAEIVKKKSSFWVTKSAVYVDDKLVAETELSGSAVEV